MSPAECAYVLQAVMGADGGCTSCAIGVLKPLAKSLPLAPWRQAAPAAVELLLAGWVEYAELSAEEIRQERISRTDDLEEVMKGAGL